MSEQNHSPKKILVLGDMQYAKPFMGLGDVNVIPSHYATPKDVEWADIILFTGGEDVTPELYNEAAHPFTRSNLRRDMQEKELYTWAKALGKHMAGICRGSQFLNVMCGGKLHQHVARHGIRGTHPITCYKTGNVLAEVTSTHHQIAIPPEGTELIAIGEEGLEELEVEAWYNPDSKALGVQFHPEYMPRDSSGWNYYQHLIKEYLL